MFSGVLLGLLAFISGCAYAQKLPAGTVYEKGLAPISLGKALQDIQPGEIVILGEEHGLSVMADQQVQVIETLKKRNLLVSVGMEFFAYPHQSTVDFWRRGSLSEKEFLQQIGWGSGISFDFYRRQVEFPSLQNEFVVALNAPRSLTSRIVKVGMEGLTDEEKSLLPPDWTLGNQAYFERFKKAMGEHLPSPEALDRYFAAQSTWDATMAWRAREFLQQHPEQVLVIIVGEFHVQFGGGLPDRLRSQGSKVTTISLLNLHGLTEDEQEEAVSPSQSEGIRADYVWVSNSPRAQP